MTDRPAKAGNIDLLAEMVEIVRQELAVNACDADQIAAAILRGMRLRYGAQEIYIPAQSKAERDAAIRRDFNGRNLDEVRHAHHVSRATIYRISSK